MMLLRLFRLPPLPLVLAAAAPVAAQPASGPYPPDHATVRLVSGAWDLMGPRGRKCRLQLNQRAANTKGLLLGFPTPCKASFPVFTPAQQWTLTREGQVLFLAADGREIARFARAGTGPLAVTLGGDSFQIDPVPGRYASSEQQQAVIMATSAPSGATGGASGGSAPAAGRTAAPAIAAAPRPAVAAPPAGEIPGPYGMTRGDGREVCKVDLKSVPAQRPGQMSASFIGPCSDQGLKVFDPSSWRFENGKLYLIARRGHEIALVHEGAGQWRKDPPTGAMLGLRKGTR